MAKTEKSLKAEKIIEKLININNVLEAEYYDAMGQDIFTKVTIKFDPKTDIVEIDDEFIDSHNQLQPYTIHGNLNKIKYGVKFYGTVYVKIIKIEDYFLDEDGQEDVSTNIYPQEDDINWSIKDEIFDQLLTRLYKFLPDSIYDIDVDLTFNKHGV
jgi:hypothetical protein